MGAVGLRIIPSAKMEGFSQQPKTPAQIARTSTGMDSGLQIWKESWIRLQLRRAFGRTALLGIVATRFKGQKLEWGQRQYEIYQTVPTQMLCWHLHFGRLDALNRPESPLKHQAQQRLLYEVTWTA